MAEPYPKPKPRERRRLAHGSTLAAPSKPIAPMSEKRRKFYKDVYAPMRDEAVGDGREPCQIQSPVCTGFVEHLHEPLTRGKAGGLEAALREGPPPIPACDACNSYVSENQVWARERGFIVRLAPRERDEE